MKKIVVISLICIQFVCACTESTKQMRGQKEIIVPYEPTGEQTFFKNFELDAIVPIETTDVYLVSHVSRYIRHKDRLIMLNQHPVYIFVANIETGKIEAFINRKGQGPGEYNNIRDIAVDERTGNIIVYTGHNKLIFFDINGQFLREEKIESGYGYMSCHEGKVILKERLEGLSCYPQEFNIYDIDKKTVQKIEDTVRVDFNKKMSPHLVKSKNIWYTAALDYNLYKFNKGKIEIPYTFKVKNPITKRLIDKSREESNDFFREVAENNIIWAFGFPVETERFIFLRSNLAGFMMINKKTSELTVEKQIKEEQLGGLDLRQYIPVDGDENRVIIKIDVIEWLRLVKAHPEKVAPKWKEKVSKMEIVEDSNPILLFYKEKKE